MDKSKLKTVIGTAGAAFATSAVWLSNPANVKTLQALFPHNSTLVSLIGFAGVIAAWWGTHPLAKQ